MPNREYSDQPLLGVGAVIFDDNKLLLVKRRFEPKAQFWTLPGGLVELGESVRDALIREVREECGLRVVPTKIVDVIDFIEKDDKGIVKYHYVLVDFEAQCLEGDAKASSDVTEVKWFHKNELMNLNLPEITKKFLKKHYQL